MEIPSSPHHNKASSLEGVRNMGGTDGTEAVEHRPILAISSNIRSCDLYQAECFSDPRLSGNDIMRLFSSTRCPHSVTRRRKCLQRSLGAMGESSQLNKPSGLHFSKCVYFGAVFITALLTRLT